MVQRSDQVTGVPAQRGADQCVAPSSGHLLEGDLLEDSLSGKVFVCLSACDKGSAWVPVLLLVSPDGQTLAGTSTLPRGCKASFGRNGSLVLRRADGAVPPLALAPVAPPAAVVAAAAPAPEVRLAPSAPAARAATTHLESVVATQENPAARRRAVALARDGAAFQDEGKFEQARRRFQQAIEIDPLYAEGYNGVGVTYFARNDLAEALRWYKRALGADPAFGDAYYNMACVYAVQKHNPLALRYLRTAFHNGYTSRDTMRHDPDLAGLRGDPDFARLLGEPQ